MTKKRKLFIWGIGVALAASLWGLERDSGLLLAPHLRVKKIEVKGCQRTNQQQIVEVTSIPPHTPILKLDLKTIAQRVESLTWVRSCEVRRILPNKVSLKIVERRPVALLHLGRLYYVDEDGTPFKEPTPGETLDYPILTGWEGLGWEKGEGKALIQEALGFLREMQDCPHLSKEAISEIHLDEIGELTIFLARRGTMINLGRGDVGLKLRRLEKVWKWITTRRLPVKYILCERPDRIVVGLGERG